MLNFQQNTRATWLGYVLSALVCLPFIPSFAMKLLAHPMVVEGFAHLGLPETLRVPIGVLECLCVVIYLAPKTATLGAILLTGFLGGAMLTHLRIGEGVPIHVVMGITLWLGLWLREPRLRAILPLR